MYSLVALATLTLRAVAAGPEFAFGEAGLSSMRFGGEELLTGAKPYVEFMIARSGEKTTGASPGEPTQTWDVATKTARTEYPWGRVVCHFQPQSDRLDLEVTLENRGTEPIFHLSVNLLEVRLPAAPGGEQWKEAHVASEGTDGVAAVLADYGRGVLLLAGETFTEDYAVGFYKLHGQPVNSYGINLSTIQKRTADTIHQDFSLPAGSTKSCRLSLRFGAKGTTLRQVSGDLYPKYAKAHPRVLKWRDRRPIGAILLASSAAQHRSKSNPRAWFNDPKLAATDPKAFRKRVLGWADESIRVLKAMDAQGMIFWDVEGEELPHPTTFIGDPRLVKQFAPEMDAVADELFAKFLKAGIRTGVCIRPSRIRPQFDKKSAIPVVHDHMDFDSVAEMSAKIGYAKKRWGCTIFYVDTNVTWAFNAGEGDPKKAVSWPMRAEAFRCLAEKHPDVLLIPEFQYLGYHSHTTAYRELSAGTTATPEEIRLAYPDAFSVIKVEDEKLVLERREALVKSVRGGDILMFPAWYNPPVNARVRGIYEEGYAR
jgi:hypothetical protein